MEQRKPTARKVPGSAHWLPAFARSPGNLWALSSEKFDTPGKARAEARRIIAEMENEAAWERQQEALMESGGPDDSAYRRDMINAGRGHLLKD